MVGDKIANVLLTHGGEFAHGLTYSGHPAACAAGLETLRILRESDIIKTSAEHIAPYFQRRLRELAGHRIVGEVRGRGMFAAVELVRDKNSRERLAPASQSAVFCRDTANAIGLMVRQTGDAMIMAPPLVSKREEIDSLITMLAQALDETAKQYSVT